MRPPVSTPVAESSWQNRKLAVASLSLTNAPAGVQFWMRRAVLLDPLLLGLERREVDAEGAHAAVGGVELGAGRRHGDPQRRVWLLVRLGQHGAGRHREELALVAEALVHPHLRDRVHVLVPRLLRDVGVGAEAAELGPRRRAAGAELEAAAGQDVEHRGPLGGADRVVELRHADDDAVADADVLRLHRAGGEEQLGRRAVRVLLQEVVLDRPHRVEAELVGQADLLQRVQVHLPLGLVGPRPRYRQLVEDAELHTRLQVDGDGGGRLRVPHSTEGTQHSSDRGRRARRAYGRAMASGGRTAGRVRRDRDDGRADRRAPRRRRPRRAGVRPPRRPAMESVEGAHAGASRRRRQPPARRACSCRCPGPPMSRPR